MKTKIRGKYVQRPINRYPGYLYRFFDAEDRLLYVGSTVDPGPRWNMHRYASPWWCNVVRIQIERFPDRFVALAAEKAAIIAESPIYNVTYAMRRDAAQLVPTD